MIQKSIEMIEKKMMNYPMDTMVSNRSKVPPLHLEKAKNPSKTKLNKFEVRRKSDSRPGSSRQHSYLNGSNSQRNFVQLSHRALQRVSPNLSHERSGSGMEVH